LGLPVVADEAVLCVIALQREHQRVVEANTPLMQDVVFSGSVLIPAGSWLDMSIRVDPYVFDVLYRTAPAADDDDVSCALCTVIIFLRGRHGLIGLLAGTLTISGLAPSSLSRCKPKQPSTAAELQK
jgi:hypothetical protein